MQTIMAQLPTELDESKTSELFDYVLANEGDIETVSKSLSAHVFDKERESVCTDGNQVADGHEHQSEQADGADSTMVVTSAPAAARSNDGDDGMEDAPGKTDVEAE